jgi:hypothetical protein
MMAITLKDLDQGGASLEFAPDDLSVLRERILDRLGSYDVESSIDGAVIKVTGERLFFLDDWDEPCLIGRTNAEVSLLRTLARRDYARGASA